MSPEENELLARVLRLPEDVRAHFAQEILASLEDPSEQDVDDLVQADIDSRTAEALAGNAGSASA